ncbi:glycosyltransferase, partial [Candidatus Uhrbacteria bacterium]|nr:glycosyltransferase [Candidatus Uhrbacteria bacterium]
PSEEHDGGPQRQDPRTPDTSSGDNPRQDPRTPHMSSSENQRTQTTLTLQLSCYNGSRYLPHLFDSLRHQTLHGWHCHVLDNASTPEEQSAIRTAVERARANGVPLTLHRVETNIGFAGAHNFLFAKHASDTVQLLNDDAILEPDYLQTCAEYLHDHPECAAVSGAIFRWDFDHRNDSDGGRTTIVDTLGLAPRWTGAVVDVGAGTSHNDHDLTEPREVFGVSGCLPMYRADAVRQCGEHGDLFDGSYRTYKEDVDLAYRLQALGTTAVVLPHAVAYHRRSVGVGITTPRSPEAVYYSYRNHLWVLATHLNIRTLFWSRAGVLPYELAKAAYGLVHHPRFFLRALRETRAHWPAIMQKRAFVRMLRAARPSRGVSQRPDVDLAIVMVSHNDLNAACLASLAAARAATPCSTAVIVVDNASTQYDANVVVSEHLPDATTLLRNGDFGFGKSCNRGARTVRARHYFFLNPDTVLTDPRILDILVSYLDAHPGVGIVAPKILYPDHRLQDTIRRFPTWFMPFIQRTSLRDSAFGKRYTAHFLMADDDHTHERPVDWAQGSALCIRGELWNTLGGFDERYHMYFEDIDLCRSAWLAGYQVRFLPSVVLVHAHGRQSARIRNILVNIWRTKETRWHLESWVKYTWKWRWQPLPTREPEKET